MVVHKITGMGIRARPEILTLPRGTCEQLKGLNQIKLGQRYRSNQRLTVKAEESSSDRGKDSNAEELFRKELQRRGILPEGQDTDRRKTSTSQTETPRFSVEQIRSQLEESRKLNSEGLEGLIPRAKQLAALGLTFFLAFTPVIIAIGLVFGGISWLYGDHFIHGGRPSFTPYIDPAELLGQPTVDRRVPY